MIRFVMITTYLPSGVPVLIYSLVLGAGMLIGLWLSVSNFSEQETGLVHLMIVMTGVLVGARLIHVLASWSYYRSNFLEVFSPVQGGYAWFGAVLGGLLTSFLLAAAAGFDWLDFLDSTVPLWFTLSIALWAGSFLTGNWYGPASESWYALPIVDEWGVFTSRAPVQLLGVLAPLLLWVLLDRFLKSRLQKSPAGYFGLSVVGLMSIVLAINGLRVDPARKIDHIYVDSYQAIGVIILVSLIAGYGLVVKIIRRNNRTSIKERSS